MSDIEVGRSNPISAIRRWVFASAGVGCVGLAYLGAILPGMPTTIFLMMACYLFTRSSPYLEQKLVRHRFFSKFHAYLDNPGQMPMRARVIALSAMWISATASAVILWFSPYTQAWVSFLVLSLAVVGTVVILAIGRWRIAGKPRPDLTATPK
ncbi:MAG TPA: YbaN family protein [Pirellulaceae bacterium]|nr:YbaN family protein [Pirellulaceae bacterium]